MPIIYAAPLALISAITFLVCILVPQWRRYKFQALLAPMAFAFCSIVTMAVIVLFADHFNLGLFTKPLSGPWMMLIYFFPGLLGSWCTVALIGKISRG